MAVMDNEKNKVIVNKYFPSPPTNFANKKSNRIGVEASTLYQALSTLEVLYYIIEASLQFK